MTQSFKYVGEWDNFKATYHRRLCKILADTAMSTFRFEQVGNDLNFYTKNFSAPYVLTLDPPSNVDLPFANTLDFIEDDLEKYFFEKRLAAETAKKKQAALDKLTDEDKKLLGIHEYKDVNIKLEVKDAQPAEPAVDIEEPKKKHPEGAYLVDCADGVAGHYAVARWNCCQYQEVWHIKNNKWASASDEVLSLEEATELMDKLNSTYLIGLPKGD